ncbi:MAG: hypothetical protein HWN67_06385 [Candidatus Helarchaeota archaeon]|nr:hypothetical protein [Candidatus Helarchaeota archaeon]
MPIGSAYIAHLIIGIFATILLSIVFFILIYSYIKSKNTSTLYFASFFALNVFWAFGSTFYPILEATYAYALAVAAISSCYLGFYAIFLFLELINYDNVDKKRAVFFACAVSGTIFLMIINPFFNYLKLEEIPNFGYLTRPSTLFSIFQAVILLGIGLEYFITAYRVKKVAVTPAQKDQATLFMAGVSIGVFGNILVSIIRWIINFPALMLLTVVVSMILVGMAYIREPEVAFVLPFEVESLMVINASGINLFTKIFDPSKKLEEGLISGMISGIRAFMEEAFGIKSQMKEIIFGDHHILLDLREKMGAFIVSNTSSGTLKIALNKFTDFFESEFSEYLEGSVEMSVFKPADKAVEKYFGFLPGAWKSQ